MPETENFSGQEREERKPDIHVISLFGAFGDPILITADFRPPGPEAVLQVIRIENFLRQDDAHKFRSLLQKIDEDDEDINVKRELFEKVFDYLNSENPMAPKSGSVVFDCLDQRLEDFLDGDAWLRLTWEMGGDGEKRIGDLRSHLKSIKKYEDDYLKKVIFGDPNVAWTYWESEAIRGKRLEKEASEFKKIVILFHFDLGTMAVFDIRPSFESEKRVRLMHVRDFFDVQERVILRNDLVGEDSDGRESASRNIIKAVIKRLNKARPEIDIVREEDSADLIIYGGLMGDFFRSNTWRKLFNHVSGDVDPMNLNEVIEAMIGEEQVARKRRKVKKDPKQFNQDPS